MGSRGASSSNASGGFTKNQGDAIEYYVSGEGMWINQYFRNDGEGFGDLSQNEKDFVEDLDGALNRPVKDDVLYRSVDGSVIFGDGVDMYNLQSGIIYGGTDKYSQKAMIDANKAVGKKITDKGYMSTTRDASIAEEFGGFTGASNPVVMRIKTSKSTRGANVSRATKGVLQAERYNPQKETLLARGQSYTVNKIYGKNGIIKERRVL